jgi:hypothetical protein
MMMTVAFWLTTLNTDIIVDLARILEFQFLADIIPFLRWLDHKCHIMSYRYSKSRVWLIFESALPFQGYSPFHHGGASTNSNATIQ